jgi:hypothetical protein
MTPTTLETKVQDFLAQKRIAVAGVSRNDGHHPAGNLIYRRLKQTLALVWGALAVTAPFRAVGWPVRATG